MLFPLLLCLSVVAAQDTYHCPDGWMLEVGRGGTIGIIIIGHHHHQHQNIKSLAMAVRFLIYNRFKGPCKCTLCQFHNIEKYKDLVKFVVFIEAS